MSALSNRVAMINERTRFKIDKNTWPPDQPKSFTPLLLIHHKGQRTIDQTIEVASIIHKGDIALMADKKFIHTQYPTLENYNTDVSNVTKEMMDILAPLEESDEPQFVMIEGAPGIGKSVLLKEIAFRWGKHRSILKKFKLVLLLCLRDPSVQKATSVNSLLQLFCEGDERAAEITGPCCDHLFTSGGKELVLLLDGYDEYPENLRARSLIAKILDRKVLPNCCLIVSSRPHASVSLREEASVKVDILGFTEKERHHFIEQAFKEQPRNIEKLTTYLKDHFTINNLCLIPFNIVILVFLYKKGIPLPIDSSKLYHHFICLSICRHLAKSSGHPSKNTITSLNELPRPHSSIFKQLCKLAMQALDNDQLVFTIEEIKATCPEIVASPETINGFGLLQAVQHFGLTGETTTFNFLHLSIQEYLAAHYIINYLSPEEELHFLCKKFWSDRHNNMFSIYVALTKGQRPSFKQFLSDGDDNISEKFLQDQLKCLHLFHCFHEAGDDRMCKSIEKAPIFRQKVIDLDGTRLSANDVVCLSLFLTSSSQKQWKSLSLGHCFMQDHGLHILHKSLKGGDITINTLLLDYNGLTQSCSSILSDIVIKCTVEKMTVMGSQTIGENAELYSMLTHASSMLCILNMHNIALSPNGAKMLFAALKHSKRLLELTITDNAINDNSANVMADALAVNTSLLILGLCGNPITGEGILILLQAIHLNNTLAIMYVSNYPTPIKDKIKSLEKEINKTRKLQQKSKFLDVAFI